MKRDMDDDTAVMDGPRSVAHYSNHVVRHPAPAYTVLMLTKTVPSAYACTALRCAWIAQEDVWQGGPGKRMLKCAAAHKNHPG